MEDIHLPADTGRLKEFTGELWDIESGTSSSVITRIHFRHGRVTTFDCHRGIG